MLHRDNGQNMSMKERLVVLQDGPRFLGSPVTCDSQRVGWLMPLIPHLIPNLLWSHWFETFDDEEGDFVFLFRLEHFCFLFFISVSSYSEPEDVLISFSLTFSFVWVLFSLEKVFYILLFLQPSQEALQKSLQLYHFFPHCLIIWVHHRENKVWLMLIFLFEIIIWIILWQ